ncbi:MAG: LppX_LprAFG lipoprotein [Actinophytocola sp.]|uniref:LppX_LprAFG lipoprotein n=1 Tax=Actinophytocola sp. TaxID=1872138 RepID=UPI001324AFC0|nr:LppX_LprAFG lipoprotein [Actinophytocola sp.]MPZ83987.1 LppX_LprAFG lipoprotein [Actinophytocola sp.]
MVMRRILVASLALVAAVSTACSDDGGEDSSLPGGGELMSDAAAATAKITSAHFTLTVNGEVPGLNVQSAEGDLTREGGGAGAAKGTVKMTLMGNLIEGEFVIVDDKAYIQGLTGDGFQELDASLVANLYDPAAILDPERGIANVLKEVRDPRTEATEEVDGVDTYRVKGRAAKDVIADLVPGVSSDVDITFWLRKDGDHQPVKASVAVPVDGDPTVDVTLSDVDKPVEITAPD